MNLSHPTPRTLRSKLSRLLSWAIPQLLLPAVAKESTPAHKFRSVSYGSLLQRHFDAKYFFEREAKQKAKFANRRG